VPKISCGKYFYARPSHIKLGWGKYCSINCRNKSQFNGQKLKCYICKKDVYRSIAKLNHSKSGKFFCSKECQTLWRNSIFVEDKHPNWTGGISIYIKILKKEVKPKCLLCGIEDQRVLAVHHKDHDRHNNLLTNLIWLCYNCHRLVHVDNNLDKKVRGLVI
jgi:5-methylcytosine-specific restriction endonuclease McrA